MKRPEIGFIFLGIGIQWSFDCSNWGPKRIFD